jgi:hypothetical protein
MKGSLETAARDIGEIEALLVLLGARSGTDDSVKGDVIASVTGDASFVEAAELAGVSPPNARAHFNKMHRAFGEYRARTMITWWRWLRRDKQKRAAYASMRRLSVQIAELTTKLNVATKTMRELEDDVAVGR